MASLNKVQLIGHLGQDPDTRYAPDGTAFTNVSVATSESWKDKQSGEKKERTEWHRVVFAAKLAEIAGEYLKKGSQVYIEGKLTTRKWKDKDGNEKYTTEIRADRMLMLGPKPAGSGEQRERQETAASARQNGAAGAKKPAGKFDDMEDDIPF